jgi:hypothetical protein
LICPKCRPHFFLKLPIGVYGKSGWSGLPCGSQRSGPPQGPYFGYFPTCWHQWPHGWMPKPVKPAEPLPWGCQYELVPPTGPVSTAPEAILPTEPAAAVVNPAPMTGSSRRRLFQLKTKSPGNSDFSENPPGANESSLPDEPY